jgi:hypothetical protein
MPNGKFDVCFSYVCVVYNCCLHEFILIRTLDVWDICVLIFWNKQLAAAIFLLILVASGSNSEQGCMLLNTRDIWLISRVGSVSVS